MKMIYNRYELFKMDHNLIKQLKLQLQYEKLKNSIYLHIIKTNTNIDIDSIIQEDNKNIHIFNYQNMNIPLIIHNNTNMEEFIITNKKVTNREIQEKVVKEESDNKIQEKVVKNDNSKDDIMLSIEQCFINLSKRITKNLLKCLKNDRKKLMGILDIKEYCMLIVEHNNRLEKLLKEKHKSVKEINRYIISSLSSLDMRLIEYPSYTSYDIDIDEIHNFELTQKILINHPNKFVPYSKEDFFTNIKNYGLSLFELKDFISMCLINQHGFNNIIYLSLTNSSKSDPYSFYILENVSLDNTRNWKMHCRLEEFSIYFYDNIILYCINMFRNMYKDIFSDNIFRDDYKDNSSTIKLDGEQLIRNIILLASPKKLCKLFQDIIIENCTFTATDTDKFNLYSDDKLQKNRFNKTNDTNESFYNIVRQLFDNIDDKNISLFLSNRI